MYLARYATAYLDLFTDFSVKSGTMLKFGNALKSALRTFTSSSVRHANAEVAALQRAALEERCILVDDNDRAIGEATKRDCHRISKNGIIPLHRAFSVYLFNEKEELLLTKRSDTKITFPSYYTNTCCSHPLGEIPGESEEFDALGIRRAARRRLSYELGIPSAEIELKDFQYLTRIHYQAMGADDVWGEHEIGYILFLKKDKVTLNPHPDEVSEMKWISKDKLDDFVKNCDSPLSPWFQLILTHRLPLWWENLDSLDKMRDHKVIQKFV